MQNVNPLNNFFDNVYCINLDKRRDRWVEAESEFQKHNLRVERVSAIDGSLLDTSSIKMEVLKDAYIPGNVGCVLSHVKVIKDAKLNNYSRVLILEDDVAFEENFTERFTNEIMHLPEDWDMLYLSGNNLNQDKLRKVNQYFYKTEFTYTTHCYAINSKLYDIIIEGAAKLELPIDEFYRNYVQQKYNCYIIRPHLSYQRAGYSDIMKGNRNYTNIRK